MTVLLGSHVGAAARLTKAYLSDIRHGRYEAAYARLCPGGAISRALFVDNLTYAHTHRRAVTAYSARTAFRRETVERSAATATVRFEDGTQSEFYYELSDAGGRPCLGAWDDFTDGRRDIPHGSGT